MSHTPTPERPAEPAPEHPAEPAAEAFGLGRLREIFLAGVAGQRPTVPVDPERLARAARRAMSPLAWAYIAGGAGRERTMEANRRAFDRWRIVPRMLGGAGERDLGRRLFDLDLPAPLLLSPIGVLEMVHPEADRAVARAAAGLGLPMILSNQASVAMEDCAAEMGDGPRLFQLYWSTSDALVESFVARAERCGCAAIVLTLDTTVLGWRPRDLDLGFLPFLRGQGIAQYTHDPEFRRSLGDPLPGPEPPEPTINLDSVLTALAQIRNYPGTWREKLSGAPRAAVQRFLATYSRPALAWDDLPRLRAMTRLPIVLKGILHPDDARRAIDAGMDGVLVSNHGGRQVDGAIGALAALPGVVDAVEGQIPVLFDSGIRTGADVFKALALGATATCLGRPWVYGLALAGEAGVRAVLANILAELDLTLALTGCRDLGAVGRELLVGVNRP